MLKKSPSAVALRARRIFYFFSSLIITVIVGYFAWNAIISVGGGFINKVLNYTDKISASLFTASNLPQESQIGEIMTAASLVSDDEPDVSPTEDETQNAPVIAEESTQDLLDDIQEKLDIIQSQVNELIAEQNQNDQAEKLDEDLKDQDLKEYEKTEEAVVCTGQININTASIEDLDKIIGVGPATAQKIIQARPFYSLSDLLKVTGIGEKTLQKIMEQGCAYVDPGLVPPDPGGTPGGGGGVVVPSPQIDIFAPLESPANKEIEIGISASNFKNAVYDIKISILKISEESEQKRTISEIYNSQEWKSSYNYLLEAFNEPSFSGNFKLRIKESEINFIGEADIMVKIRENGKSSYISQSTKIEIKEPESEPPPTLESIEITTPATKLVYIVGEELNITGLIITGNYSDNSMQVEAITDADVAGFDSSVPVIGQVLIITIDGQSVTYTVDINSAPTLQSIAITTQANKLAYTVGDLLDITGLVVAGTYSDGSTEIETIAPADITGFNSSVEVANQVLTITFNGQTTTYTVNITEPILPKNLLLNEFFEDWTVGNSAVPPDNWEWGGTISRINQFSDGLVGDYSVGLTLTTLDKKGFYQYGKVMDFNTRYYVEIWVKGVGMIDFGFKNPHVNSWRTSEEIIVNTTSWKNFVFNHTTTGTGDDGGIRIRAWYDDTKEVFSGSKLLIGAAWLGTTEPPEGWPP